MMLRDLGVFSRERRGVPRDMIEPSRDRNEVSRERKEVSRDMKDASLEK